MSDAAEATETEAPPEATEDTTAPEGGDEQDTAPDPYEAKLARAQAQSKGLQRELLKHQAHAKEAATERDELKARLEELEGRLDNDTIGLLKERGRSFDLLQAEQLKDEDNLTPEQQKIADLEQRLQAIQEREDEAKTRAEEEARGAQQKAALDAINTALGEREDTPFAAALGGGQEILNRLQQWADENKYEPPADVQVEIALAVEKQWRESTIAQLTTLVERDKSGGVRKQLTELLAASNDEQQSDEQAETSRRARGNGSASRTLTRSATSNPGERKAPTERVSRADRESRALERLEELGFR